MTGGPKCDTFKAGLYNITDSAGMPVTQYRALDAHVADALRGVKRA